MTMLINPFFLTESVPASYRYWRIYITNGNIYVGGVAEMEWRTVVGGSDITTPSTATFESSYYTTNNKADKLIDNSFTTYWKPSSGTFPQYAGVDLVTPTTIRSVGVMAASPTAPYYPIDFKFQGSSDNSNWVDVASFTGISGWQSQVFKEFVIQ